MVERIVDDIDEIVRYVRFDGWQSTHAGEREVKMALRKTLFKYKLHQDQELFGPGVWVRADVLLRRLHRGTRCIIRRTTADKVAVSEYRFTAVIGHDKDG